VLPRLAQRYASNPTPENQQTLAQLARKAPEEGRAILRQGVAAAFEGRGMGKLSPAMEDALFSGGSRDLSDPVQLALAIKRGDEVAIVSAVGFIGREEPSLDADRIRLMQALGDMRPTLARPAFLEILSRSSSAPVREAAVAALGRYDDKEIPDELLRLWPLLDHTTRQHALALLVSRRAWAHHFLREVAHRGVISKADVPDDIAQRARLWNDKDINTILDRYFGRPQALASADKQRRADELIKIVTAPGNEPADPARGRVIFETRCAACHKLFDRGGDIGPDLTPYERINVPNMVLNIVDPNLAIREGFGTFLITTRDDRALMGFVAERDANRIVLRDVAGQRTTIAIADIREERVLPISLMAEGLLNGLSDQDLRHFFTYLSAPADPTKK
jgi:putative heme-binding domain-containing protein